METRRGGNYLESGFMPMVIICAGVGRIFGRIDMERETTKLDFYTKRFVKQETVVSRQVADECILVPIRHQASEVDGIYSLSTVAAWIWELIDGERSVSQIRDAVLARFDVDVETASRDIEEFFEQLVKIGAIGESQ